jgi:predicted SAM-dependent methyltransferase
MSETADVLRLHIGGEAPKPGWKILNIQPGEHVDFVGSCTDLSEFASGSVEAIYASHVLEHLGYLDELPQALKEFRRVLRQDGLLRISVPDLEALCRLFLDPRLDMSTRFHVMRVMFGGQMDPHDFHKAGLTYEFMADYLAVAGFRNVERVSGFELFADMSSLSLGGIPVCVNLQAVK